MKYETNQITLADVDDIVVLTRMQVEETISYMDYEEDVVRHYATYFANNVYDNTKVYITRDQDGEAVGYLVAYVRPYLFQRGLSVGQEVVYVIPERRDGRIFVQLMQTLDKLAEDKGAKECYAGIANGVKIDGIMKWFKRKGYEKVGYYVRKVL